VKTKRTHWIHRHPLHRSLHRSLFQVHLSSRYDNDLGMKAIVHSLHFERACRPSIFLFGGRHRKVNARAAVELHPTTERVLAALRRRIAPHGMQPCLSTTKLLTPARHPATAVPLTLPPNIGRIAKRQVHLTSQHHPLRPHLPPVEMHPSRMRGAQVRPCPECTYNLCSYHTRH